MKRIALIFPFLLFVFNCFGGDIYKFPASAIPVTLLKDADVILRIDESEFEFISDQKSIYRHHYAMTILNEDGLDFAIFISRYDHFSEINSAEGYLYSAEGKLLKKVKKSEMADNSTVSSMNLIDDSRALFHRFDYKCFPFTIEYSEETEFSNTLFVPNWMPAFYPGVAVEMSTLKVISPENFNYSFKQINLDLPPTTAIVKNKTFRTWIANNINSHRKEPLMPEWSTTTARVLIAPDNFKFDRYTGSLKSWKTFGDFILELNKGMTELPSSVVAVVHNLTDTASNNQDKIKYLYEYLQNHTRYVNVSLGIGGLQTKDAKFVAQHGYGDCKALSNYMKSLLKEAGIVSYYTLVKAGENEKSLDINLPSQQFNHVILCVPDTRDTTWLECTSSTLPTGYLGNFTDDRYCLLISHEGGVLTKTPKYSITDNRQHRKTIAKLDSLGNLSITLETIYSGLESDELFKRVNYENKTLLNEYLNSRFELGTYQILSSEFSEQKTKIPSIKEALKILANGYASLTSKRIFFCPEVSNRMMLKLPTDSSRTFDIYLSSAFSESDTAEITLPEGYVPEKLPDDVKVQSQFGDYEMLVRATGNTISCIRHFNSLSGTFPANSYNELVSFYSSIYVSDRSKVVLVKK